MNTFSNLPIKWKIICMLLLVSIFTLILAGSIFVINDLRMFKANMIRNLEVLAEAVGKNNLAALRFEDADAALQILSSLEAEPQVIYAALYTSDGKKLVHYQPTKIKQSNYILPESSGLISELFNENVEIRRPVFLKKEAIGEIFIKAELSEYRALLSTYTLIVLTIFITAIGLSLLISIKLQSILSKPILDLAQTTKKLSEEHNYSIRVEHKSQDEIGTLFTGFNTMLSEIEKRDMELANHKIHLEKMVETRTKELSETNEELSNSNKNLNQEIKDRKKIEANLKNSLDEKEILLGEIHHRVKNNLQIISSLLRLQSNHTPSSSAKEIFQECSQRIETMAKLYEKIYSSRDLSEIELEEYLKDLVNGLLMAYGVKNGLVSTTVITNSVSIDIDTIVPCSLIIQELISNSLKYAFPNEQKGKLEISIRKPDLNEDHIEMMVSDNGVGFPEDWDFSVTKSLGLQLVKRLSEEQLKGNVSIDRENGTSFKITFPLKTEDQNGINKS